MRWATKCHPPFASIADISSVNGFGNTDGVAVVDNRAAIVENGQLIPIN
jgi:hypothetical protein